ncbi:hypothetical protein SLEP1_g27243 [Rubroshorea leprosula]|uniref:Peptidase A1 domain-containing protein n=1 Tax=Rubroshorea leprosula TaxID=152421 RepID=A0AAV5JZG9_9ROSI|nr:hypothetical protein SLEP1_g27243 [Rubroshorea leprosula]
MVPYRILLAGVILPLAIVLGEFPTSFKLERTIPSSQRLNLSQLIARDAARHRRLLTSSGGIVNFSLNGDLTAGLYYTKVFLGSPPQEFHVLIDTGSYISWVSCKSCHDCPRKSEFPFQLNFFDPGSSSTASLVSCSDQRCNSSLQSSDFICESNSNQCHYNITYVDGSGTIGYYVSDLLQFDTALKGSVTTNSTGTITFGCSVFQSGGLTESNGAVDGIFGFGQQNLSIISQLASKGIAPNVFSHCLKGDNSGGGILVLGKIVEPNIVYTSLVPSQPYYNINLQSISVNGRKLAIDPSVFATSNNSGTIVDSGTTLVVLAETAYDVVIDSINSTVLPSALQTITEQFSWNEEQCYSFKSSDNVPTIFPQVSFNFSDGASMILNPQDYLLLQKNTNGVATWCLGFGKIPGSEQTILGDVILQDKIVIYDLDNQTVGWVNYDCSQSVNVLTINGTLISVQAEQPNNNNSPPSPSYSYFVSIIMLVIVL